VRGRLRVSVDPWFARMMLAAGLQRFLARYPLLLLDFSTSNCREEMMTGVDVAVRFGPPDASSLIVRKLLETPILTVAAPAYLERHGQPRSPHDLVHHEALLFRDPQTGLPFPWEFHRGGEIVEVKVSSRLVLDDPSVAVTACVAGQGHRERIGAVLLMRVPPSRPSRGRRGCVFASGSRQRVPQRVWNACRRLSGLGILSSREPGAHIPSTSMAMKR
jgi:DNA-binding transcriptional LysR family regulator